MSNGPELQVPYHGGIDRMTLRDYFAAIALHGLLVGSNNATSDLVEWAYEAADAMMAESNKGDEKVAALTIKIARLTEKNAVLRDLLRDSLPIIESVGDGDRQWSVAERIEPLIKAAIYGHQDGGLFDGYEK